jgi:TP901 family phage tail tape measure protein
MDVGTLKYNLEVNDQGSAKSIDSASKAVGELKGEFEAADKKGAGFNKSMFSMNQEALSLSNSIVKLGAGVLAAGAALGGVALKQAADFQSSMANVNTLLGQSKEEIGAFGDQVLDLSKRVPIEGSVLSESLYNIVSAGISDTNQAMNVLEESARLGVAGLGSTESAADLLTSSLNAFQIDASRAGEVSNILFETVKNGKTTIDQLATAFGQVAPIANAAGVSFEELQAATAALTTSGLPANVAQTQLKVAFNETLKTGTKLEAALQDIGISNTKAAIESDGFVGVLKKLQLESNLSEQELINLFSSQEAGGAAVALLGAAYDPFIKTMGDFEDGIVSVDQAFQTQSETLNNQVQILKNEFNAVLIEAGTQSLPGMSDAVGDLNNLLSENSEEIANVLSGLATFATELLGGVLEGVIKFASFLGESKLAMSLFAGAIVGLMVPALGSLALAAGAALLPLLPYAAAFAAIAAAGTFLYDNLDAIGGFMQDKFPKAFALGSEIVGDFKQAFDDISESMKTSLEKVEENSLVASNETVANLVEMSQESQKAILEMKLTGGGLSTEMKDTIVNNSLEMRNQVINSIDGMIEGQIGALEEMKNLGIITQETFDEAAEKNLEFAEQEKVLAEERAERIKEITELLDAENQAVIQDKEALVDELSALEQESFNTSLSVTDAKVSEILELQNLLKVESGRIAAEQAAELAQEAVTAKDEAIALADEEYREQVAILTKQKDELGILNEEQYNDAITNAQEIRDGLVEEAELAAEEVVSATEEMAEEQGLVFDRSTNTILTDWEVFWKNVWDSAIEFLAEVKNTIVAFFTEAIPAMYNGAKNMLSRFWDGIKKLPERVLSWAGEVISNIIQGIKDGLSSIFDAASEIATNVLDGVKELPGKMLEAATNAVSSFISGITGGLFGVQQASAKLGHAAEDGMRGSLKIQSPSKVFRELGDFTAEGFLLGIEDGSPAVLDAMNTLTEGLIAEAEEMEESLDFGKAFEELEEVVDDAYEAAEDAVLDFVKENQAAQEDIRSEIEKTENDINKLTQSFENAAEASKLKFEDKATGIVIGAEDKSTDIQDKINEKNEEALEIRERITAATEKGAEGTRELERAQADQIKNQEKLLELQADLAEQQLILQTAEENGVVTAEQLEEARRVASLNPLEALIEEYEAEKLAREDAFNEEILQLEERKVALEDSLALRQEEYENFILTLSDEDAKFTQSVTNELKKREKATTDSINRLITLYNKLAAAKKSAGRKEGGFAEGSDVGFSEGGATGIGHDNEVAGDVHKNEYVVPAWQVRGMPNVIKSLEAVRTKQVPMGDTVNNNQKNFSVNQVINNDVDAVAAFNRLKWMM